MEANIASIKTTGCSLDDSSFERLVGLPAMEAFESLASWIARAALSQGVRASELIQFLGLHNAKDVDLSLSEQSVKAIEDRSYLPGSSFLFARHIFANLMRIDPEGTQFLLFHDRRPQYRYCPVCLDQAQTKHFMVHWRFRAWRYCPLHNCLMETSCRKCNSPVLLPVDMLTAGRQGEGIAYLDTCMSCGNKLSKHWKSVLGAINTTTTSEWERMQLSNGRAVLAALYFGNVRYVSGLTGDRDLLELKGLAKGGHIPNMSFCSTAASIEARLRRREAQMPVQQAQIRNRRIARGRHESS